MLTKVLWLWKDPLTKETLYSSKPVKSIQRRTLVVPRQFLITCYLRFTLRPRISCYYHHLSPFAHLKFIPLLNLTNSEIPVLTPLWLTSLPLSSLLLPPSYLIPCFTLPQFWWPKPFTHVNPLLLAIYWFLYIPLSLISINITPSHSVINFYRILLTNSENPHT